MTNKGKVRDHNENFILVRPELGLYIACDGMGGHNAGELLAKWRQKPLLLKSSTTLNRSNSTARTQPSVLGKRLKNY